MKSIGIYGDSFAGNPNHFGYRYHWSTLLAKEYGCEIKNYGLSGTSVYYSYKKFVNNFHKHDLNIFLVTEPGRYIQAVEFKNGSDEYIPSLMALEHNYHEIMLPEPEHLRGWFMCSDSNYNSDITQLMIKDILSYKDNTVIIPCFPTSLSEDILKKFKLLKNNNLWHLQSYQTDLYRTDIYDLLSNNKENYKVISGHFIPEVNEIFYKILSMKIKNNIWNWEYPDRISCKYKFADLYIKIGE